MNIQDTRRARLAQLIEEQYGGSQTKFVEKTGENQSEISGLLRTKSFGERKARKLEERAGVECGWLDMSATPSPQEGSRNDTPVHYIPKAKPVEHSVKRGYVAAQEEPEWMALVYLTQRELDLISRFRLASEFSKSLIETAAETASKEESGPGAAHQF